MTENLSLKLRSKPKKANVKSEYEELLPKLSTKEYEALKLSIKTEGQQLPIIINQQNMILDGHNRYNICMELGVEPKYELKTFPNKLVEKKFVIEVNLKRRHLNDFQKTELAIPLEQIERELAKQRHEEQRGENGRYQPLSSNELEGGQARDIVAKAAGISPTTYHRAKTVTQKGSEQLKQKVRKGKTSINAAYIQINRAEKHKNTPVLPDGKFDVIYADPPWKYDFCLEGDPRQHYQVVSTQEICELQIPAVNDAILFLWATNPKLEDALRVIKAWGFKYKTNLVWVKNRKGPGYYFQSKHELLLVAKRGEIPPPTGANRPPSVLVIDQQQHSQKPTELYNLIETMYPNRKYLELFATEKREKWTSWGLGIE